MKKNTKDELRTTTFMGEESFGPLLYQKHDRRVSTPALHEIGISNPKANSRASTKVFLLRIR
jgi:hypothetical protein